MTVFFLVVGLEIKREIVDGHLATRRSALLPIVGAVGGMVLPAMIYLAIAGGSAPRGWAIPMATDIALAVGVLAVAGSRLPTSMRAFLLGLAIVDDIGAIVIIAVVFSTGVSWSWLAAAVAALLAAITVRRCGTGAIALYLVFGVVMWLALHKAGVHPTLAGVALGLLVPTAAAERLERAVHPWSSYVIVPLFALANAGIVISVDGLHDAARSTVAWGVFAGLLLGKPLGVLVATSVSVHVGVAELPADARRVQLLGVGMAAGIGFTVAIFITDLALANPSQRADAKLAILAASVVAALAAWLLLDHQAGDEVDRNTDDDGAEDIGE